MFHGNGQCFLSDGEGRWEKANPGQTCEAACGKRKCNQDRTSLLNTNERIRAAVMRAGHECKSFEPLPHIIDGAPFVYGKYSCVTSRIWNENLDQKPRLAIL